MKKTQKKMAVLANAKPVPPPPAKAPVAPAKKPAAAAAPAPNAEDAEAAPAEPLDPDAIKALLLQILGLPEDADDQAISTTAATFLQEISNDDGMEDAANARLKELTEVLELSNEVTHEQVHKQILVIGGEHKALTAQFANERKARVALLLDNAIRDGLVTPAQRPEWEKSFKGGFEKTLKDLANGKPVIKTQAATEKLGERKEAVMGNSGAISTLVNARMEKNPKETRDEAWKAVKTAAPHLFANTSPAK